jgi:hypothetical protein
VSGTIVLSCVHDHILLTAPRYSSSFIYFNLELKLYLSGDEKSDRKEEAANDLCPPHIVQHQQAVLQLWAQQQLPANSSNAFIMTAYFYFIL